MTTDKIYMTSDNLLTLDALTDTVTGAFINNATVTVTLKDSDGTAVTGQTFPATMTYVSGSDGKYQTVLEDGLVLTEYDRYVAEITADAGGDAISTWYFELQAVKKRS